MPYQVEQLLEGKSKLVFVSKDDTAKQALSLMLEHDYSQLPVITVDNGYETVDGIVTYEGIIRGIRNFNLNIDELRVRDVMGNVFVCNGDDDLFDILDRLKETNAVLVQHKEIPEIQGIITTYDTTEYFRNRTEDLMRVEDIESTIKELTREAYSTFNEKFESEVDEVKLDKAVKLISQRGANSKPKSFEDLTMAEYINLLTIPDTWNFFEAIFNKPNEAVKGLLHKVRETRNLLAHFRGDLSPEQRDQLKFTVDWLARCQDEYINKKTKRKYELMDEKDNRKISQPEIVEHKEIGTSYENAVLAINTTDFIVSESAKSGGRYAALADWLQSQPGRIEQIPLTFNQVEEIIGSDLPDSARVFRGWWANDSVGHSHSQLWLDAGWRTTYINLTEGRVTFSRIREREKAYIDFFGNLLVDLRRFVNFSIKDVSPDGASWMIIAKAPRLDQTFASYVISFSRTKKLRVELYLDLLDKEKTKLVFEKLLESKSDFEAQLGPLEWERLDNRRASRIALYKDGHITEEDRLPELRKWAVDTMYKLYNTTIEPVEKAIREVKQ